MAVDGHPRQAARNNHKPKKTALLLAYRIVGEISDRELLPGASLAAERDMLEEYGVARGTLREALRFLEMQGVIAIKTGPGGGPVVQMPDSRHLASILGLVLQFRGARFRTVVDARLSLEPLLASKAAANATEEQLEEIEASVDRMSDRLGDADFFLNENEVFHELIAAASGNDLFSVFISSLAWITDGTALGVEYRRTQREHVCAEHRVILERLRERDAAGAESAMRQHVADFAGFLERRYPAVMDQRLTWQQISG